MQLGIKSRSDAPGFLSMCRRLTNFPSPHLDDIRLILTYMMPELKEYRTPLEKSSVVVCFHLASLTDKGFVAKVH